MKPHIKPLHALRTLVACAGALLALASGNPANAQTNTGTGPSPGPQFPVNTNGTSALTALTTGTDNTAYGYFALKADTTGIRNTALGSLALTTNIVGQHNTAVGYGALRVSTASSNTALGYTALYSNTSGSANTALGWGALFTNNTGLNGVAIGHSALYANTTGNFNTALGVQALRLNTTGASNVAIGYQALSKNVSGGFNTAIGDGALLNGTGTDNIALGEDAGANLTTGNNNIRIGNKNGGSATENNIIRIGTTGTHTDMYLAGVIRGNGSGLTGITGASLTSGLTLGGNTTFQGDISFLPTFGPRTISVGQNPTDTSPGQALTILAGSSASSGGFAYSGGNLVLGAGNGYNQSTDAHGGDAVIRSGANSASAIGKPNGGSIVFQTGGALNTFNERMRILENGNVGIGTGTPADKLQVVGGGLRVGSTDGAVDFTSLFLSTNQIYQPIQAGNSLNSSQLTIGTERGDIILNPGGNNSVGGHVGIGTSAPKSLLHVNGDYYGKGHVFLHAFEGDGNSGTAYVQARDDSGTSTISLQFRTQSAGTLYETLRINSNNVIVNGSLTLNQPNPGNNFAQINFPVGADLFFLPGGLFPAVLQFKANGHVSVGTANPPDKAILNVGGGVARTAYTTIGYYSVETYNYGVSDGGGSNSIYATNQVVGSAFIAFSDERIKNIQGRSDSAADLRKLVGIEITDYFYKDVIGKGSRPQKKVIAQQVEKVYPQAVSQSTDVVPDIYKQAEIKDGWVSLATDLRVGDRVKLISDKADEIHEVLEVRKGAFRTAFQPGTEKIFVFGREVKDFRTVDYEAIAMLNVSATQELAKKLEAKDAELARLRAESAAFTERLAALEARDQAREARLARLEAAANDRPAKAIPATLGLHSANR